MIALVLISAVALLAYPTVSDQYNRLKYARRIYSYSREMEEIDTSESEAMLEAARTYNLGLKGTGIRDAFGGEEGETSELYQSLLNPNGDGVMGVIEIPAIGVRLPIYHSAEGESLERGAGHMEGTALPVGGEGTHCGIAGHRALPSARIFTDLDQLKPGDVVYLMVLNNLLVYEVDETLVVLPHETESMAAVPGEDLLTLVTCTPYGVNTHRLLVRCRRATLENVAALLSEKDGVTEANKYQGALVCAAPVAAIGLALMLLIRPKKRYGLNKPGKNK